MKSGLERGLYLSQNFAPAVALAGGRIGDDPGHFRGRTALVRPPQTGLAGPLCGLTHAAVCLLGSAVSPYFHRLVFCHCPTIRMRRDGSGAQLYTPTAAALGAAHPLTSPGDTGTQLDVDSLARVRCNNA